MVLPSDQKLREPPLVQAALSVGKVQEDAGIADVDNAGKDGLYDSGNSAAACIEGMQG